jgi:hypothetical protein
LFNLFIKTTSPRFLFLILNFVHFLFLSFQNDIVKNCSKWMHLKSYWMYCPKIVTLYFLLRCDF